LAAYPDVARLCADADRAKVVAADGVLLMVQQIWKAVCCLVSRRTVDRRAADPAAGVTWPAAVQRV
jgi:hypothetical protein